MQVFEAAEASPKVKSQRALKIAMNCSMVSVDVLGVKTN